MAGDEKDKEDGTSPTFKTYNIGDKCYEGQEICPIDNKSINPYTTYFSDLNNKRRDKTFPTFVRNTNEKNQTIEISSAFLDKYLPKLIHHCQVLDLGAGEGDLSSKVATYMKGKCENIRYEGIDRSELFVATTAKKLLTLDIKDQNIVIGNCFGGDVEMLVDHPTLLIASQIVFYAPDINKFVDMVVRKMGAVAIIIGQSDSSFLNHLNKAYATSNKQTNVETKVEMSLTLNKSVNKIKLLYNSIINFPKEISVEKVAKNAFESLIDPKEREAREILEFAAGSPLEYLEYMGHLDFFIQDVKTHLELNKDTKGESNIGFWNFMTIIVPNNQLNEKELQVKWKEIQKQKFSRGLNQFENALQEGNIEVVTTLFKQGLVTCEFYDEEHDVNPSISELLYSFFVYVITFPYFYRMQFEAVFGEIGGGFKKYYSKDAEKLQQYYKYNYAEIKLSTNDLYIRWNNDVIAKGYRYSELTSEKWHIQGVFYTGIAFTWLLPGFLENGIKPNTYYVKMAISMNAMFIYMYYNFFNVGNYAIHNIDGDDKILEFYLFDKSNLKSLNFQTSKGQTALHLAIIINDTEKALSLLNCKATRIDIPDIYGKLPIHYAIKQGNIIISNKLFDKGSSLTAKELNFNKLIFDFAFISGKALFLHAYFTDNISNLKTITNLCLNILLLCSFVYSKSLSIKFPESLYFHIGLLLLDPFGSEENLLYKEDSLYKGYSLDTPLHVSTVFNHTEISRYLIASHIESNVVNAKGETPLHFASANINLEIVGLLLDSGADINFQGASIVSYLFYFTGVNLMYTAIFSQSLLPFIGEIVFFKVLYDEFFKPFCVIYSGTPLHYSVSGLETSFLFDISINQSNCNKTINEGNFGIVKYLIEHGAEPDLVLRYYINIDNQIINYAINLKVLSILYSTFLTREWSSLFLVSTLLTIKYFLAYELKELKPIDIVNNEINACHPNIDPSQIEYKSKIFDYLKQFTVLNQYTDVNQVNFYSPIYIGYLLGIISYEDIIWINEYGIYKGGSGQDQFIMNADFAGKKEGWKVIIKDYNPHEDTIDLTAFGFEVMSTEDLHFEEIMVMNKLSIVISTTSKEEIVTLYNYPIEEALNIQFKFSEGDSLCPSSNYLAQVANAEV